MKKKVAPQIIFAILAVAAVFVFGYYRHGGSDASKNETTTINIWYTDEALTDYINSAALSFYENTGVRVVPVLHSGLEYTEDICEASEDGSDMPDLYIAGTENIESYVALGIAEEVSRDDVSENKASYSKTAVSAVSYNDNIYGYPFYFETAYLLYNKTYLDKMNQKVPSSIADILTMAEECELPEEVDNIFIWDVTDIFYNYFFAGAYMNVGGSCGDDEKKLDICNDDAIACLQVYQNLNQFFYIDTKSSSYGNVINDFVEGKTLFTIATSDAIATLEHAKAEGEFDCEYGIAPLPGIDKDHVAGGLSTTSAVFVNGYSEHADDAKAFARYLTNDEAGSLYDRSGKVSCIRKFTDGTNLEKVQKAYEVSKPLPKIRRFSSYWIELENAYMLIWDGADVEKTLKDLNDKLKN